MTTKTFVNTVVKGLQEQKAHRIVTADLSRLGNTICDWMVICEGTSNTHVSAIAENTKEFVREKTGIKPRAMEGFENCEWVVADYGDVMLHVLQRGPRAFYDLEHLWEDAHICEIPD